MPSGKRELAAANRNSFWGNKKSPMGIKKLFTCYNIKALFDDFFGKRLQLSGLNAENLLTHLSKKPENIVEIGSFKVDTEQNASKNYEVL